MKEQAGAACVTSCADLYADNDADVAAREPHSPDVFSGSDEHAAAKRIAPIAHCGEKMFLVCSRKRTAECQR